MIWITLLKYEFKKIISRRMVWVSLLISLLLILFTVGGSLLGGYYVNGEYVGSNYEMFETDSAYQQALDGRAVDGALLREMQEAYGKVNLEAENYSSTEEYQRYARPYSAIYNYVRQITGLSGNEILKVGYSGGEAVGEDAMVEELRQLRLSHQEKRWEEFGLTEEEKEFWRRQEEALEEPVTFRYAEGYSVLLSAGYTVGLLEIFVVALCLAGVFAEEHVRRTDQLILTSYLGRGAIFGAKFVAGLVFALLLSALFAGVALSSAFCLYGFGGFESDFRLLYAGCSCDFRAGSAILLMYGCVVCAGVFTGALTMLLSQVLRSSVGTLGVIIGMILLPMLFTIPDEYRILGQLWSYLPSDFVAAWTIFSPRTVPLFGRFFQAWQVVPVMYTVLGLVFALLGRHSFVRYQVRGR